MSAILKRRVDVEKVADGIVDDLTSGGSVFYGRSVITGRPLLKTAADVIADNGLDMLCSESDAAAILTRDADAVQARLDALRFILRRWCCEWLETPHGQDAIEERCRDMEQDGTGWLGPNHPGNYDRT